MRFTRLRLNGFKSFVDPTDLVIAEGLTGIVGPNGCGKSNLLEALRWVMGENRPTAMRGGGMEDVIFAGAATRGARHFAEVHLTIDNTARLAPAAFNAADVLDISRRITRDAGSAYRVQGKEVRARDVQMLFADASTGAHSPALVKQGQIAELIGAKPTARRRILEEAAGIAGLYQRRHEAELRLRAAEGNLARVDDVTEQLAAQIAQLSRQARAAARYREIGAALRRAEGLLLWRRWAEAQAEAGAAGADLAAQEQAAAQAEAAVVAAGAARELAEAALPPCREEESVAGALLHHLRIAEATLAEEARQAAAQIAGLAAQLAQMQADAAREAALTHDAADTLGRLRLEAGDLARAGDGHDDLLADAAEAARVAAATLADHETVQARQAEDLARLAARHQSALRLVEDQRRLRARAGGDMTRAAAALDDAAAAADRAAAEQAASLEAAVIAAEQSAGAEAALEETEAARADLQERETTARAARAAAEAAAAALAAEVAALDRLIRRATGDGTDDRMPVLDLVSVAAGHELAFGAALGDDLRLPLAAGGASGWTDLPPTDLPPLPAGVLPLAAVVTAPGALARRLAQTGIVTGGDGEQAQAQLHPGQRLVSPEGDLWRWDGLWLAAADAPSATALRLLQVNRLAGLRRELDAAQAGTGAARQAHDDLAQALAGLAQAEQAARSARREADRALSDAQRRLSRAEAERDLAAGRGAAAELALERHREEAEAAAEALVAAEAALDDLPDIMAAQAAADLTRREVAVARDAMLARRSRHDDLRRQGEARARRAETVARELAAWTDRQATATARSEAIAARQAATSADLAAARAVPATLADRADALRDEIAGADHRLTAARTALARADAALSAARLTERDTARAAADTREARARAETLAAQKTAQRDAAAGRIRDAFDLDPAALADQTGADPAMTPPVAALEAETATLRRSREALGAVNLRAEEDSRAVQAEHDMLLREKTDLEEAIRTLRGGIGSLNREGRERLLAAFDQVNGNFTLLFRHLFGGGEARLELVESDDPLEAGLEIMCQPPGKKLSTLSLLSGGEQTLTALALIFGVFLANPAPICVLDEVDAPLDDANVTRFCDLMDEMTRRTDTRFLVITHHAVTMSRMDRLFGVTMAEQGVSQLVSVDLRRAAALVA